MIKKLINTPHDCVSEAVEGALLSDSRIKRIEGHNILVRADYIDVKANCVAIISGGGSGHEPAHAGFIGDGMLTAAVLGNVFASPSVSSILAAMRVVAGPKGVLMIVKNYTGDRLNFGMAAEMAKQEGIAVDMVIVADDCALPLGKGITGGRGLAGTIFVHKVAGACAATGATLAVVHAAATEAARSVGTLGVALTTCTVPGTPASDRLARPGLIEVGMGIHGEPGREQVILPEEGAADFVAERLVAGILDRDINEAVDPEKRVSGSNTATAARAAATYKRMVHAQGQRVAVLLNNLGALPVIEMQVVTRGVMLALQRRGLLPVRAYVGAFMTSLEMCGVSLSLLMIDDTDSNGLLQALDTETSAPAWMKSSLLEQRMASFASNSVIPYTATARGQVTEMRGLTAARDTVLSATRLVCERIVAAEAQLTAYDAICGDGDCGVVMQRGAEQVLQSLDAILTAADASLPEFQHSSNSSGSGSISSAAVDLVVFFNQLADSLGASMGGTSGVLLELGFRAMTTAFLLPASASVCACAGERGLGRQATQAEWVAALNAGVRAIAHYGGASEGMRTMLDALVPAASALSGGASLTEAATAAKEGAACTAQMESQAGRSNYVSQELMSGTPDPGAYAVSVMFAALSESIL